MDKYQLKKNRLDLEYHGEAQKSNTFLILLTTGILGFIGTFIWLRGKEKFYYGISITILVLFIGLLYYWKTRKRMIEILEEVEKI